VLRNNLFKDGEEFVLANASVLWEGYDVYDLRRDVGC